jgi:hypothetical protein
MQKKSTLSFRTKIIIAIVAIVVGIGVIVGGVLLLLRDEKTPGPFDQTIPNTDPGQLPWDDL